MDDLQHLGVSGRLHHRDHLLPQVILMGVAAFPPMIAILLALAASDGPFHLNSF